MANELDFNGFQSLMLASPLVNFPHRSVAHRRSLSQVLQAVDLI